MDLQGLSHRISPLPGVAGGARLPSVPATRKGILALLPSTSLGSRAGRANVVFMTANVGVRAFDGDSRGLGSGAFLRVHRGPYGQR